MTTTAETSTRDSLIALFPQPTDNEEHHHEDCATTTTPLQTKNPKYRPRTSQQSRPAPTPTSADYCLDIANSSTATTIGTTATQRPDAYAKGQAAIRAAITAKGVERRHWEQPIAPFLESMTFLTRYNPYSVHCPVQRQIVNPNAKSLRITAATAAPTATAEVVVIPAEEVLPTVALSDTTLSSVGSCTSPSSDSINSPPGEKVLSPAESIVDLPSPRTSLCSNDEVTPAAPDSPLLVQQLQEVLLGAADGVMVPVDFVQEQKKVATVAAPRCPVYRCLWYYRVPTTFPKPVLFGRRCVWALEHCVRRKLGGVCCDAHPLSIANMIYEACEVVPAGVDMFTNFKGRCSVWFHTEAEALMVEAALNQRVWMAPIEHGFALWTDQADAQDMLQMMRSSMRTRANGVKHFAFPTHLLTVERWETR